jgi:ABC-2 type transport system ATP-binding protein
VELVRTWARTRSLIVASHLLHEVEALDAGLAVILGGRLVASGTAAEIREMVDAMPAEVRIRCDDPRRVASLACGLDGVEGVRIDAGAVVVATRRPAALYDGAIAPALDDGLSVTAIVPGDRSLEGIFGQLVRLHRGVKS